MKPSIVQKGLRGVFVGLFACLVLMCAAGVTAADVDGAPPGEPLAWARFEDGPEQHGGVPYWWLGKYELTLEIGVEPEDGHALDLCWGSKDDTRGARISVNGQTAKLKHGGYDGFRWVRVKLPGDISGSSYTVRMSSLEGQEAFLAAVQLTDTGADEGSTGGMPEGARRIAVKTSPAASASSTQGGAYAEAHPEILKMWRDVESGAAAAPAAEKVESDSSPAFYRWPDESNRDGRSARVGSPLMRQAGVSARIAGDSLGKVHRWLHEKALEHIDEETGLYRVRGKWDYADTAADCYPFLTWAAWATDRDVLNGPVRDILRREQELCNVKGALPAPYNFEAGKPASISYEQRMFGASEYVKDGLIPIVAVTGRDVWYERMKAIEEEMWERAKVETDFGPIPSEDIEVNGEQLQVLPRLYRMSGEEKFLRWAERIADHYLSKEDFVPQSMDDHACEIIGGLGLLLGVESQVNPEKAKEYRPPVKYMLEQIIKRATNEDGLLFNRLDGSGNLTDNWGYDYVAHQCYDMVVGKSEYRPHIEQTLRNLVKPKYSNYPWEGGDHPDGYGDSIEGAIYVLNHNPVSNGIEWVDRETMKNLVPPARNTLGNRDLWGVMKLHANGVRTVIMHALMHTRGCLGLPWQQGLELGAAQKGETLAVVIRSDKEWSGRLKFDMPRHREYIGFERNWPRMNTLPEWFTVKPDRSYRVRNVTEGSETIMTGKELHEGREVHLEPGEELRLVVSPQK